MAQTATAKMTIQSPAFEDGQPIPRKYTEDGENVSPPLLFGAVPTQAEELALLVEDPDAPTPQPWVHWILAKIPLGITEIPEGISQGKSFRSPPYGIDGQNSWGSPGYRGPAPPRGHGVHHYHFHLYALNASLEIPAGTDKDMLMQRMERHVLAHAEMVGTYERKR